MKQLLVIVKPFCAEPVLRALGACQVKACLVREVKGYGRQKGYLDQYQGSEYSMAFLPKVEIAVYVEDEHAAAVEETIVHAARTGRIGDGKVFVLDAAWPGMVEF